MKITLLQIPDVFLIEPDVFEDERGFFFESFRINMRPQLSLGFLF